MPKLKAVIEKLKYIVKGEEKTLDETSRLDEFKNNFTNDKSSYDPEDVFDMFERVYRGTTITQKNVNSKSNQEVKQTNVVRNFTSEFIEAKVDTTVPLPSVKSLKPGMDDQADMIREKIMSDMSVMPMDKMADYNERTTYMHGISPSMVTWDSSLGSHEYIGEKKILDYHPKQVIPQAGVYRVEDMQRIHFMDSKTKSAIKLEYGVDVDDASEEYPEINYIDSQKNQTDNQGTTVDKATQITTFYRDEDGDIGKFVWVNNTVLEDKPKYFYPRVEKCADCGTENPQGTKKCEKCGGKKLTTKVITEITIEEDLILSPITYPQKVKEVQKDSMGMIIGVKETIKTIVQERFVPKGTVIPIPAPKMFPVAVRRNVPYNFSFRGRSDVELLQSLQESYKKIQSRVEEKVLNAQHIVAIPDKLNKQVTNDVYSLWKGPAQLLGQIKVFSTQAPIGEDLIALQNIYNDAQTTIGITPSFQGKYDSSAKSGRAKEIQVEQTQSILSSPIKNKQMFYAELFKIMFYFDLNFTQETRPYFTEDSKGDTVYKEFNKYELLLKDKAGKWYFNTDFVFKASINDEIPTNKGFIFQQVLGFYQNGALTVEQLWQLLAGLNFPIAEKILQQVTEPDQRIALLEMLKQLPPQELMMFLQAPTDEQIAMLDELTKGATT